MDEEKSTTTEENNQETDSQVTDQQTDDNVDNLDDTSKSTDDSADDDTQSNTDDAEDDSASNQVDDDLDEWAEKTGRPKPTTDRERELYQEIRNGQREYTRNKQKETQDGLDKAIKDVKPTANKQEEDDDERDPVERRQDALEARLAESEAKNARSEYFNEFNVTEQESKVMGEILKEKVDKGGQAAFDYWTDPDQLSDWHALAKARLASTQDTSVIAEEAARKERARIAKESQANGASRSASTTQTQKPKGYDRTAFLASDDD